MGDKTRMPELSRHDDAYVRPSPSAGTLGGVTRTTNDAILLCAKAGFDMILVETVGVGQSETAVAEMVDCFTLLVGPGGGDELQGMKKGIVEMSDLLLVNKADGPHLPLCQMARAEYQSALKFGAKIRGDWEPVVQLVSSHTRTGLPEAWETMLRFHQIRMENGTLERHRMEQRKRWLWRQVSDELMARWVSCLFLRHPVLLWLM
jgi:LAO/AO transport system kinase